MKRNFISNSTTSVRIFKNGVLEALSKVHFTMPLFIYVPVVIYLSYKAFAIHVSLVLFLINLGAGIITWTITEYLLHRFVFHFQPTSAWGRRLHFIFHGVHHDYPRDAKRLVMPPSASIPIAVGLYCLCSLFFYNKAHLYAFFSGFLIGYLTYDMMHYAMHHHNFKNSLMKKIKEHHMLHHYGDATKGYGVSSALWDIVFRSNFTKKKNMSHSANTVSLFSAKELLVTITISVSYLLISAILIGFRSDQLFLMACFNLLYYASSASRKLVTGFSIFIVYWILFDYMKAFPNYRFNTVHIESLYNAERYFFPIHVNGKVMTPNEFLAQHTTVFLNALSGIFYLCWIPVPLLFAAWLFYKDRAQFLQFAFTFFLVNMLGFVIYYLYPAAPPWYVAQHGFYLNPYTPGNMAGLHRFDDLIHMNVFQSLYAKSSNVFAAMPSLHASYPILVLYYGIKNKLGMINGLFAIIMLGIWFAAVYTNHHYVLDVLAGILCAVIGILLFQKMLFSSRKMAVVYSGMLDRIR